jgi:hypothetical protein
VHQRAYASATRGFPHTQLFNLPPRRRDCVVHRMTHRSKPCKIYWIAQDVRSEDVLDDEVVRKAAEGLARVSHSSIAAFARSFACASFHTKPRVGRQREGCRVRVVVSRGFFLRAFESAKSCESISALQCYFRQQCLQNLCCLTAVYNIAVIVHYSKKHLCLLKTATTLHYLSTSSGSSACPAPGSNPPPSRNPASSGSRP